jgi:hypothetical protein
VLYFWPTENHIMTDQVAIPFVDSDASMDEEALAMLGGVALTERGIRPITPGVIALLDLIDSPLVCGGELTMLDLYRAIYVVNNGVDAVSPVLRAIREQEALQNAEKLAGASVDAFGVYCGALRASAAGWNEFDEAAAKYAASLGAVSHVDIAAQLRQAITTGTAGFRMLESSKDDGQPAQKKSTRSGVLSGLPGLFRKYVRRALRWTLIP